MITFLKRLFGTSTTVAVAASTSASEIDISTLVPEWKPSIERSAEDIGKKCHFYLNYAKTIVVFSHGTCVIVEDSLPKDKTLEAAKAQLSGFLQAHPDMTPLQMKDGNLMVEAPHVNALSLVTKDDMEEHADLIKSNHQKAIPSHEVLITPLGNNVFDEFGMNALFGRTFIFWDAQDLEPVAIHRTKIETKKE